MNIQNYVITRHVRVLHDINLIQQERPIQVRYFNDVVSLFLKTFSKFYATESLTEADKANLRRYLEKMIEAKEAISGSVSL